MTDQLRTCNRCEFKTDEPLPECPECGGSLFTRRRRLILGWILLVDGAFLVVFMAGLMIVIGNVMRRSADPGATTRFDGTPAQAYMIFGILGLVMVFGFSVCIAGWGQIRNRRRNPMLVKVILWLAAALFVLGELAMVFDGGTHRYEGRRLN